MIDTARRNIRKLFSGVVFVILGTNVTSAALSRGIFAERLE